MVEQIVTGSHNNAVAVEGSGNTVTIYAHGVGLVLDRRHVREIASPSNLRELIIAEGRVIGLVEREAQLEFLGAWLAGGETASVTCVVGRAGCGKTRLALELAAKANAQGWVAGFASVEELARLVTQRSAAVWKPPVDTLVIIDDAASAVTTTRLWLDEIAKHSRTDGTARLRIVLLERDADPAGKHGWWGELKRRRSRDTVDSSDLLAAVEPITLEPIATAVSKMALISDALRHATRILDRPPPDLSAVGLAHYFNMIAHDDEIGNEPLSLLMAAIVAAKYDRALDHGTSRSELALEFAGDELERYVKISADQDPAVLRPEMSHLLACVTLQGGCSFDEAYALVEDELTARSTATAIRIEQVVVLLADLLPTPASDAIDRIRPDLVGEAFVVRELTGPRTRTFVMQMAIVERAYQRTPEAVVRSLVRCCRDLANGGSAYPAMGWLSALLDHATDQGELRMFADHLTGAGDVLSDLAFDATVRLVQALEEDEDDRSLAERAHWYSNLAAMAGRAGDLSLALRASEQAVYASRLVDRYAVTADGPLISALEIRANAQVLAGDREGAFDTNGELIGLLRRRGFEKLLAPALVNWANDLSNMGRHEESISALQESLAIEERSS